jgi:hypothetical protein
MTILGEIIIKTYSPGVALAIELILFAKTIKILEIKSFKVSTFAINQFENFHPSCHLDSWLLHQPELPLLPVRVPLSYQIPQSRNIFIL